ncbi:general transcription factor II-I repeat domain-containing protein 2-like [Hydra vulgaris]|uniref:General transcription factor II-I repeat domain-containing protein 2-like n=1 Tax=Hydra vulgaris TaxID=6087 RepID=A0ABM4CS60_HYDVU
MLCLLCDLTIATLKNATAKRHYENIHKDHKYAKLEGEARKNALAKLKSQKSKQQQTFSIVQEHGNRATEATFKIALILGKSGKPNSDIETLKACLIKAVSYMDPDKLDKYKQLPLSRRTITDRQHELATNNFKSNEELFALATLKGKTRGCDILAAFKEKICQTQLQLKNLVSICSDGAPFMRGKNKRFIAFLKKELPDPDCLITFHCILHQQSLCAKAATLDDTLKKVIGIVNYIRANSLRHRQFRNLLQSDEETYFVDLPYYSKVRWLSQGLVLQKLLELRKQIKEFFTSQKEICELSNPEFCRDAAFLCDLMTKHNMLNISLQGKTKSIYEMWQQNQAFKKKLVFLKDVITKSNLSAEHFPELTKIILEQKSEKRLENNDISRYETVLDSLIAEFNDRFKDFEEHNETLKLAFQPHIVEISTAPEYSQMELIELSEDSILKSLFDNKKDPLEIWKTAVEYPKLRQIARRLLSCFGTTYCCESTFSHMIFIKFCLRS